MENVNIYLVFVLQLFVANTYEDEVPLADPTEDTPFSRAFCHGDGSTVAVTQFANDILGLTGGDKIMLLELCPSEKYKPDSQTKIICDYCGKDERGNIIIIEIQRAQVHQFMKRSEFILGRTASNQSQLDEYRGVKKVYLLVVLCQNLIKDKRMEKAVVTNLVWHDPKWNYTFDGNRMTFFELKKCTKLNSMDEMKSSIDTWCTFFNLYPFVRTKEGFEKVKKTNPGLGKAFNNLNMQEWDEETTNMYKLQQQHSKDMESALSVREQIGRQKERQDVIRRTAQKYPEMKFSDIASLAGCTEEEVKRVLSTTNAKSPDTKQKHKAKISN